MKKTTIIITILIICIVVIFSIFIISKFYQTSNSTAQGIPCVWVYKTNEDYSNLRMGSLWFNIDKNKTSVSVIGSEPYPHLDGNNGYLIEKGNCYVEGTKATVFFKEEFNYQTDVENYVIMAPFSELFICSEEPETSTFNTLSEEVKIKYNNLINSNQLSEFCTQIDTSETIIPRKHESQYI